MIFIYNIFIGFYFIIVRIAALWNKKAKEWISGRKNWEEQVRSISGVEKIIWIHCSSAGEFEQAKPIIENLKAIYLNHKVLVSFFSPSGFKVGQNYPNADITCYLPLDTRKNAQLFLKYVHPELVIFVKYEFWYHHLNEAAFRHIPILLLSAVFRQEQAFFKWYGKFYKKMLFLFRHIFVQDEQSLDVLRSNNIQHCSISGDTRFDRVKEIAENFSELNHIRNFIGDKEVIVAGSTWKYDEGILCGSKDYKLIIAPHEINEQHLLEIEKIFPESVRYSQFDNYSADTLIIDNVGMLSRLYSYATISYVGGGFTKDGIHNILEAAVYGKPVIFGPNYKKYREAKELIDAGGAFSILNAEKLKTKIDDLLNDRLQLKNCGEAAKNYVENNTGATKKIIQFIQEKRLLTN